MIKRIFQLLLVLFIASFFTQLWGNAFMMILDGGYFIPNESTIFTFKETVSNEGSGEWWLYGEDYHHYYGQTMYGYLAFPKNQVQNCPNFNPTDVNTWCKITKP